MTPRAALALALFAASLAAPAPAAAQGTLAAATQNMRLAMELCLRNYRTAPQLADTFGTAGFALNPSTAPDFVDFEAPGVWGTFSTSPRNGYCNIVSPDVPLAVAEEMGLKLAMSLFGERVEQGRPERNIAEPLKPCEGLHIFATQKLIAVSYAAAGNSGECLNDGTSAIQINM